MLVAVIGAITLGAFFRIVALLHNRSLWVDEAMLALNVATRSYADLARPLDQLQLAPILFLWLQRAAVLAGGVSEWTARLIPLLCGILALPLVYLVARRIVSPAAALVAAIALGVSPLMVAYSVEAKPYAVDAFTALLLLWLVQRMFAAPTSRKEWYALLIVGIIAPWFSLTSLFLLPVIGVVLFAVPAEVPSSDKSGSSVRHTLVRHQRALVALAAWGLSSLASLVLTSDPSITAGMNDYWQSGFLSLTSSGVRRALAFAKEMIQIAVLGSNQGLPGPGIAQLTILAGLLAVVGVLALLRRNVRYAILLAAPLVLACVASLARQYPMASRVWLFSVPCILVAFVVGLDRLAALTPAKWRVAVTLVLALPFVVPALRLSLRFSRRPAMYQHARPVVRAITAQFPNEPVYVFARSTPAWLLYSSRWPQDTQAVRQVMRAQSPPAGPAFINAGTMGRLTPETGAILTRHDHSRVEIFGVSSGYRMTYYADTPGRVAPQWAAAEVARIRQAAGSCVILFFVHVMRDEETALMDEMRRQGAQEAWRVEAPGSKALRLCVPARG